MSDVVRFYFSFRSPYSWLGFYRLQKIVDYLPVTFEYIPAYPLQGGSVDVASMSKQKMLYIGMDIKRFTDAYGLKLNWPKKVDTDWRVPSNIFFYAMDNNLGIEFALNAYSARFEQGLDIAEESVIKNVAKVTGLDPDAAYVSADDQHYQDRFEQYDDIKRKDRCFGVPIFIYNGNKYWGNDRLEWLIRDIFQSNKMDITDLSTDPFLRPF